LITFRNRGLAYSRQRHMRDATKDDGVSRHLCELSSSLRSFAQMFFS